MGKKIAQRHSGANAMGMMQQFGMTPGRLPPGMLGGLQSIPAPKRQVDMAFGGSGFTRSAFGGKKQKKDLEVMASGQFARGSIKSYHNERGFGFINTPNIPLDIFFMKSDLPQDLQDQHGDRVR